MVKKGTYHYKVTISGGSYSASAFGEMAEDMPDCSADSMFDLEKAMVAACEEKSGMPGFGYQCSQLTPKVCLFTACIRTAAAGPAAGAAAPAAGARRPRRRPRSRSRRRRRR